MPRGYWSPRSSPGEEAEKAFPLSRPELLQKEIPSESTVGLLPEQQRGNNPNLCFNWFSREDTARDKGEAASIAAMISAMVAKHALDPARVFITGLSAGGASMAAGRPDRP